MEISVRELRTILNRVVSRRKLTFNIQHIDILRLQTTDQANFKLLCEGPYVTFNFMLNVLVLQNQNCFYYIVIVQVHRDKMIILGTSTHT